VEILGVSALTQLGLPVLYAHSFGINQPGKELLLQSTPLRV